MLHDSEPTFFAKSVSDLSVLCEVTLTNWNHYSRTRRRGPKVLLKDLQKQRHGEKLR